MAEETRNVKHTMPLANANTPLALILPEGALSALAIGIIAILAGLNDALVQLVMAARVLYGMANKGLAAATGLIMLAVFALVNLSLAQLRWRERRAIPWLPFIAATGCIAMLIARLLL